MKTERRHELQTNQLADSLAHWIEAAKPYSRAGLAVIVALAVGIFGWGYLSASSSRRAGDGWTEYFSAMSARDPRDGLDEVAKEYSGLPVAEWARLVLADIQLADGTNRLLLEKVSGKEELGQATSQYLSLLESSRQPMVLQRATFGLARAHEAQGALEKAREEYRSIKTKWPDSPYVSDAESRAKDLDEIATKSFYDWFAKYEPPRPLSREPGTPGVKPDFEQSLEAGAIKLPSVIDDKNPLPKFGEPTTSEPSTDQPVGDQPAAPATDENPGDSPAPPATDAPQASDADAPEGEAPAK